MFTSLLLLSFSALSHAQPTVASQGSNGFKADQNSKMFSFRLPQSANVHDVIYITKENGVVLKKYEIDKGILASGSFAFSNDSIPSGTCLVTVASNSLIKYQFKFNNKGKVTTVILKDGKLTGNTAPTATATASVYKPVTATTYVPTAQTAAETVALTFNSKLKEFTVSSGIPFRAGTKIEVFNSNHTLIAIKDVTEEMINAKKYTIKVDELQPGSYFVNVDDVKFGAVTYSD